MVRSSHILLLLPGGEADKVDVDRFIFSIVYGSEQIESTYYRFRLVRGSGPSCPVKVYAESFPEEFTVFLSPRACDIFLYKVRS